MPTKPLFLNSPVLTQDLFAPADKQSAPLSVTALSLTLKTLVEKSFANVRVKGEISGLKKAASGHIYFALKDEESVLDGVCWRGGSAKLGVMPQDGLEVICTGKITTYPGRSKYQMVIETMEAAGVGALLKLLEERRQKLEAEGLFSPARKKPVPFLPKVIGVITSPTGAVIRDILHRLTDRFPRHVLLWPSLMQGEEAAEQVAQAIRGFNAIPEGGLETPDGLLPRPDVLIVARGGGSLEDLWAFNEEIVVRAAAESDIPLISAVGHETDTTLIDYAADLRAPTPTGAAEKAVPVRQELQLQLSETELRLRRAADRLCREQENILSGLSRGLPPLDQLVGEQQQRLDDRTERMENAFKTFFFNKKSVLNASALRLIRPDVLLERCQNRLIQAALPLEGQIRNMMTQTENRLQTAFRLLESFSYERVLERGFILVLTPQGKPVTTAAEATAHSELQLRFSDDTLRVSTNGKPHKAAKKQKQSFDDKQGQLL
ncbi:MAG: exodeoxyribonuclease VII large subunit [Alphaproteobacteria bacterium]|nr:exodeoxyribonuclease VII large subunit [Alphaproteobacteria bacterium]